MTTLFYDSFQNTNNWVGGNGQSPTITVVSDPKGQYQKAINFVSIVGRPDTFSTVIYNNYKSFTVSFDYLGVPKDSIVAFNLGCVLSVSDGSSLSDYTIAYAGAVSSSYPPMTTNYLCIDAWNGYSVVACPVAGVIYTKPTSFTYLHDDSNWHHYSISFTTNNQNIRLALSDFAYASTQGNNPKDCYFANLLVTDSYGPSPFIATSVPENFRSISVDALNQIADTVSYANSNAAIAVNLGSGYTAGGYAQGDNLNDIASIVGSAYNDVILGNSDNNKLEGGNGNDILTAGQGNDILVGGNGADTFIIANDITAATISDLEMNIDKIDLRLFNGLYTIDIVKSSSTYTNGNTVINLGGGKTLTLENINKADLTSATFIFPEQPTAQPTTFSPTLSPSYSVSPTFSPTTALPTLSPTSKPTLHPTFSTSPTLSPTTFPSLNPSPQPTKNPTPIPTTNKFVLTGNDSDFVGTSIYEEITVNSPNNLRITLNGGGDRITFFTNAFAVTTITDFSPEAGSIIDISVFTEVHSFTQLRKLMTFSGGTVVTFVNEQKIILENLPLSRLDDNDFVFSVATVDDDGGTGGTSSSVTMGAGIAAAFVTTTGIGSLAYCYYRKGNSNSNIQQNIFHLSDKKISPEGIQVHAVFDIIYDNPILNTAGILENAYKFKGVEGMNAIIEIGSDKVTYNQFIQEQKQFGFEKALSISVEKYDLKNYNKLIANNLKELSKASEYIPSIAYVLKEIICPHVQNLLPEEFKTFTNNAYDVSISASIALNFVLNNLASIYSGNNYIENNFNTASYAAGYIIPGILNEYMPEWIGSRCTSAVITNTAILAGKSYFSAQALSYYDVTNALGAIVSQCKNEKVSLPGEAKAIASTVDIGVFTGLLAFTKFEDQNLLGNIKKVAAIAPTIMLTDLSVKSFLSYLYEDDNNEQCIGDYSSFDELF